MKKTGLLLSTLLTGCCAICSTVFIGANIIGESVSSRTVEYKMEENLTWHRDYLVYDTEYCDSFDGLIKFHGKERVGGAGEVLDFTLYKELYLKGYNKPVLLITTNFFKGATTSGNAGVYTKIGGNIVYIGSISGNDVIRISNGMLYVKKDQYYERYAMTADGKSLSYYGLVKDNTINPQPLIFDRAKK